MILHKNEKGFTPLELVMRKNVEKCVKNESQELVKYILFNFVYQLFKNDHKKIDIFKNASR